MMTVSIDNRCLLLALDRLCRDTMKEFELSTLLPAARTVAGSLRLGPADVPVEGY